MSPTPPVSSPTALGRSRLVDPGVWQRIHASAAAAAAARAALFLDRDGVLVDFVDRLHRPDDVRLASGAAKLVAACNRGGIAVVVVTNQSGVDRGLYGWEAVAAVQDRIAASLSQQGAWLDAELACPFHPDFTPNFDRIHRWWRKPGPGMVATALAALRLDPARSWLIGDSSSDIEAGVAARLAGTILLRTGLGAQHVDAVSGLIGKSGSHIEIAEDLHAAQGRLARRLVSLGQDGGGT